MTLLQLCAILSEANLAINVDLYFLLNFNVYDNYRVHTLNTTTTAKNGGEFTQSTFNLSCLHLTEIFFTYRNKCKNHVCKMVHLLSNNHEIWLILYHDSFTHYFCSSDYFIQLYLNYSYNTITNSYK